MKGRASGSENMQPPAALTYLNGGPGKRSAKLLCHWGPIGTVGQQAAVEVEKPEGVGFREDESQPETLPKVGRRSKRGLCIRPKRGVVRRYNTTGTEVAR